jgi:hypothetical protein
MMLKQDFLMLNDAKKRFFFFNNIKIRYLKKVSLVICIELYCLVHLDFSDLKWRNFEWTQNDILAYPKEQPLTSWKSTSVANTVVYSDRITI